MTPRAEAWAPYGAAPSLRSGLALTATLVHDDRLNLTYFFASVLTALTPIIILAAIGWFIYRAYRKGARSGGERPESEKPPDEWRYKG